MGVINTWFPSCWYLTVLLLRARQGGGTWWQCPQIVSAPPHGPTCPPELWNRSHAGGIVEGGVCRMQMASQLAPRARAQKPRYARVPGAQTPATDRRPLDGRPKGAGDPPHSGAVWSNFPLFFFATFCCHACMQTGSSGSKVNPLNVSDGDGEWWWQTVCLFKS